MKALGLFSVVFSTTVSGGAPCFVLFIAPGDLVVVLQKCRVVVETLFIVVHKKDPESSSVFGLVRVNM